MRPWELVICMTTWEREGRLKCKDLLFAMLSCGREDSFGNMPTVPVVKFQIAEYALVPAIFFALTRQ